MMEMTQLTMSLTLKPRETKMTKRNRREDLSLFLIGETKEFTQSLHFSQINSDTTIIKLFGLWSSLMLL